MELCAVGMAVWMLLVFSIDAGSGWGKKSATGKQKADLAFDVFSWIAWVRVAAALCLVSAMLTLGCLQFVVAGLTIWEYNRHHQRALRQTGMQAF